MIEISPVKNYVFYLSLLCYEGTDKDNATKLQSWALLVL